MITPWRQHPLIYEINTWTWLHALSQKYGRPISLGSIPDAELDTLAQWGLDAVWLMGIWERSPAGRQIALDHPGLQAEYHRALPDFVPADVVGSPYAVRRYAVDPHLGDRDQLVAIRQRLAGRGLRLILDFVPNHVATDHPWLETNPDCFIQGQPVDLNTQPDHFFRGPGQAQGLVFAHGRDPYFPAWTDTAQLHAFSPVLRANVVETLLDIAGQCDGVRCDMAMLVTNRVFAQTWSERAGQVPEQEYWQVVIPAVKDRHPGFLFIGEVYWDMEWELQQQGFDYTYDKRLYDRLVHGPVESIVGHLRAGPAYQERLVRLIENHDEPRAASALGQGRSLAAAVIVTTLPGATLLHEGQFVGHRVKLPVQLSRRPHEQDNLYTRAFYHLLLDEVNQPVYHRGEWRLRDVISAWEQNTTHANLIAYTWQQANERRLIVVNYSSEKSQGRVSLPDFGLNGRTWHLRDLLDSASYERDGGEMDWEGLYIDLAPWQAHIFDFC